VEDGLVGGVCIDGATDDFSCPVITDLMNDQTWKQACPQGEGPGFNPGEGLLINQERFNADNSPSCKSYIEKIKMDARWGGPAVQRCCQKYPDNCRGGDSYLEDANICITDFFEYRLQGIILIKLIFVLL